MYLHNTINIVATMIALSGLGYQIYSDQYLESSNSFGTYLVIAALFITVINEAIKSKNKT